MSKKIKPIITLAVWLTLSLNLAKAQVEPPTFLCVINDTLTWDIPINTCGDFIAYEVYVSDNFDGPYSLLATVNDPMATSFYHANPTADIWYYYLQSIYDCPGEPVITSDTLDNRIPESGPILAVSVTDENHVRIDWGPSPSPEVYAYIISRNTSTGTTIIDTVYDATFYVDTTAAPDELSETYFVVALDRCGNTSLVGTPQETLFLNASEADPCERTISLSWEPYENWPNGVESYEILVSVNGGARTVAATIDGSATSYDFENVGDQDVYCFEVRAVQEGTNITSTSNEICSTPMVIQGVRDFLVYNASVTEDNEVELAWVWDPTAALSLLNIQASTDNTTFLSVNNPPFVFPLVMDNNYLDASNDPNLGPVTYRLETTDDCGVVLNSNAITTLFLQGQMLDGGNNILDWTDFSQNEGITTESYELYRITGTTTTLLSTNTASVRTFNDLVDISNPEEASACYYVIATSKISMPDGSLRTVTTRSNTVCLQQRAKIFVPNAFVPDGLNKTFFPKMQFGDPAEYMLVIYDRFGSKLFESESIETGWDGKSNGKVMPQDVYTYYIRVVQAGGQVVEKKGSVLLLR